MAAYNIPLEVKSPQIENPLDVYGKVLQNQQYKQQALIHQEQLRAYNLENQTRENNLAAEKDLGELLAKNSTVNPDGSQTTDHGAVIQGLAQRGHGAAALKYDADRRADQTAALANAKTKLEMAKQQADQFAGILNPVVNAPDAQKPVAYAAARAQAIQRGLIRPEDAPPDYDPNFVNQHYQSVLTAQQQIDNHRKDLDYLLQVDRFKNEVKQQAPKTADEWLNHATKVMSAAGTEPQWAAGMNALKSEGAPDEVLKRFSEHYTPDAQAQAGEMGITPEQRKQGGFAQQRIETAEQRIADAEKNAAERNRIADERTGVMQDRLQFMQDKLGANGGEKQLTPGQRAVEERNISALEYGTANRPGLHDLRTKYGAQLRSRKDEKGNPLYNDDGTLTDAGQAVMDKFNQASGTLQEQQFRKARLNKIDTPHPDDVKAAGENETIAAPDGSAWVKRDGVAYFSHREGQNAPARRTSTPAPGASPVTRTQTPANPASPAPRQQASQPAPQPQQQGPKVGQRFKNAKGDVIKWDGTNYVDEKTGKPYRQ